MLCIGFLNVCYASAAQTPGVTQAQFSEQLRFYDKIEWIESEFKQIKTIAELGVDIASEGNLFVRRGRSFEVRWEVKKPAWLLVELNPSQVTIKSGNRENPRTEKWNLSKRQGLGTLVSWLRLDSKELYQAYTIQKETNNIFLFTPKRKDENPFKSLKMFLHKKGFLSSLEIQEKSGDVMKIEFREPKFKRVST